MRALGRWTVSVWDTVLIVGIGLGVLVGWGAWPWGAPGAAPVLLGRDLPEDGAHSVFLYASVARGLAGQGPLLHLDGYWFPVGRPLLDGAWNVVDAAFAAPLLWLLGPFAGTIAATGLFGLLNVLAGGWLGRRLGGPGWPAVVGAVGLGFAPYAWAEVHHGRPTQALLAPVALALGLAWGPATRGLAAGAVTALTGWIYWFQGLFTGLLVGLVLAGRQALRRLPLALLLSGGVALLLVAPFAVALAARWDELQGTAGGRAFPVPVALPWQLALPGVEGPQHDRYLPTALALLGLLGLGATARRGAVALLAGVAGLYLLALGDHVVVGGVRYLLPWHWLSELPLLSRLWWPYRALGAATVALAGAAALGATTRPGRWLAGPACVLVIGQCLVSPGRPPVSEVPPEPAWHAELPPGPVLVLPALETRSSRLTLLQQPRHRRPLVNGMGMADRDLWPPAFAAWWAADPFLVGLEQVEAGGVPAAPASAQGLRDAGVVAVVADRAWLGNLDGAARGWLQASLGEPTCPQGQDACTWLVGWWRP